MRPLIDVRLVPRIAGWRNDRRVKMLGTVCARTSDSLPRSSERHWSVQSMVRFRVAISIRASLATPFRASASLSAASISPRSTDRLARADDHAVVPALRSPHQIVNAGDAREPRRVEDQLPDATRRRSPGNHGNGLFLGDHEQIAQADAARVPIEPHIAWIRTWRADKSTIPPFCTNSWAVLTVVLIAEISTCISLSVFMDPAIQRKAAGRCASPRPRSCPIVVKEGLGGFREGGPIGPKRALGVWRRRRSAYGPAKGDVAGHLMRDFPPLYRCRPRLRRLPRDALSNRTIGDEIATFRCPVPC